MAKDHLNEGGVVTLFVQLYESNMAAVKSEIGTFLEVFPNGVVWGNTNEGKGYDLVLLGQKGTTKIDVDAIQAKLQRPEYAPMTKSLREIGMNSAVDLFSTYAGRKPDLEPWLRDATLNRDKNLRLQYLAGLGLNLYQADVIYADMLRHVNKLPGGSVHRLGRDQGEPVRGDQSRAGTVTETGGPDMADGRISRSGWAAVGLAVIGGILALINQATQYLALGRRRLGPGRARVRRALLDLRHRQRHVGAATLRSVLSASATFAESAITLVRTLAESATLESATDVPRTA